VGQNSWRGWSNLRIHRQNPEGEKKIESLRRGRGCRIPESEFSNWVIVHHECGKSYFIVYRYSRCNFHSINTQFHIFFFVIVLQYAIRNAKYIVPITRYYHVERPSADKPWDCGVCNTPELWRGAAGLSVFVPRICICACAGAAESLHLHAYTHIYINNI